MAGADLPDTLTPEQAARMGFVAPSKKGATLDMPDTLTPEQAKRLGFEAEGPAPVPGIDMGPTSAARRARAGRAPGPRALSDEEAGTDAGAVTAKPHTIAGLGTYEQRQPVEREYLPPDMVRVAARHPGTGNGVLNLFGAPKTLLVQPPSGEMSDPLVQMMTASAMGQAAGAGVTALGAGALAPAVEGGVVNKVSGGDFTTGAALGGAPLALARGGRAAKAAVMERAPARVAARIERNLAEDVKKSTADKITAIAKKGALAEVVDRNPLLRKSLAVANDNPAKALKVVRETKDAANASRAADVERMQAHYADKPASSQATISGVLDDNEALLKTNLGDRERQAVLKAARKEITEFGDDLRKAQGLPPAVNGDYSGTVIAPKDLRDLEQTIGGRAYSGIPEKDVMSVKRRVNAELYRPLAKQMNALAEGTPGVDAKAFAATGKDIHVLIPVEEALRTKIDRLSQGKKTLGERLKEHVHTLGTVGGLVAGAAMHNPIAAAAVPVGLGAAKLGARVARGIDYRLAESQLKNDAMGRQLGPLRVPDTLPLSYGVSTAETTRGRDYAARVSDAMGRGMSLKQAVESADAD